MFEIRPMIRFFIYLTIGVSLWHICFQGFEVNYLNQIRLPIGHPKTVLPPILLNFTQHYGLYNESTKLSNKSSILENLQTTILWKTNIKYENLAISDRSTLVNLRNFKFLINQSPCQNSTISDISNAKSDNSLSVNKEYTKDYSMPLALILIHSAPANKDKRLLIRETWGSFNVENLRVLFLLGAVNTVKEQESLKQENEKFSDIVQGNFIDTYRNLTYKHVMALKWFTYFCPSARFIIKLDDDVFVNTPNLIDFLRKYQTNNNLLFCQLIFNAKAKRSYRSKWRVSVREYSGSFYPSYCPGHSIIYSSNIAFKLYQEAQTNPFFWIDDVYITGILAAKANLTITASYPYLVGVNEIKNILDGSHNIGNTTFLFAWQAISKDQFKLLWKLIKNYRKL